MRMKNGLDISDLITGYDLKGEDLTGAIITKWDASSKDISECKFTRATIGSKDTTINLNRVKATNCSFIRTQFVGEVVARQANFQGSNFKGAFLAYFDYKYADLRRCDFCDSIFSIGTSKSLGAKFSTDFFKDLAAHWNIKIEILEDKE